MNLLENVNLMDMTTATCNSILNDLLVTKFNNDTIKRFDSLIKESDDSEKLFRIFAFLILYHTSFDKKDKAVNFIKQKIKERLNFINEELNKIKENYDNAAEIVEKTENIDVYFQDNGIALKEKIAMLPAKYILICRKYGENITEEEAKQFIDAFLTIESVGALEGFFKTISKSSEEQDFYNELKSILISRLNYKKEKKQREKDYNDALKICSGYETEDDKFRSERDTLKKLLAVLEHKNFNTSLQENLDSSLQSNAEKVIETVKTWFNSEDIDSHFKRKIEYLSYFQVFFTTDPIGQIKVRESFLCGEDRITIIKFKECEDYFLFNELVKKVKSEENGIDDDLIDEEPSYDYAKITLICLMIQGFFVEKTRTIEFIDDKLPEFIEDKKKEMRSRRASETPLYVGELKKLRKLYIGTN